MERLQVPRISTERLADNEDEVEPIVSIKQHKKPASSSKIFQQLDDVEEILGLTHQQASLLRSLVLEDHIYNWRELAQRVGCSRSIVILHWQKCIYPQLKLNSKVAGVTKWSLQEDSILTGYIKKIGFNWNELGLFLPERSVHSAEGRRRRLMLRQGIKDEYTSKLQSQFVDQLQYMNKHQYRKYIIRLIAGKKAQHWSKIKMIDANEIL